MIDDNEEKRIEQAMENIQSRAAYKEALNKQSEAIAFSNAVMFSEGWIARQDEIDILKNSISVLQAEKEKLQKHLDYFLESIR